MRDEIIKALRTELYPPKPVRRSCIQKSNGKMRLLDLLAFTDKLVQEVMRIILTVFAPAADVILSWPISSMSLSVRALGKVSAATNPVTITVAQHTPMIALWPTAAGIEYGQTLADAMFTGGNNTERLDYLNKITERKTLL